MLNMVLNEIYTKLMKRIYWINVSLEYNECYIKQNQIELRCDLLTSIIF